MLDATQEPCNVPSDGPRGHLHCQRDRDAITKYPEAGRKRSLKALLVAVVMLWSGGLGCADASVLVFLVVLTTHQVCSLKPLPAAFFRSQNRDQQGSSFLCSESWHLTPIFPHHLNASYTPRPLFLPHTAIRIPTTEYAVRVDFPSLVFTIIPFQ